MQTAQTSGSRATCGRGGPYVYAFHGEVRRILYTTNALEALNATLRRAVRARGHFPTDEAALKLLYLVGKRFTRAMTA